jgi:hypothetical protein
MIVPPGQVLDKARAAASAGDHELALENYERFFDRALLDQGEHHNYYGVRLSYCLDEWVCLGKKYPAARERLETKAVEALAAFEATGDSEKFHDFQSIRDNLDQEELVLSQFIYYHQSKPDLANLALRLMWNRLIEAKRWDVCSAYLGDFESKYESALSKFEQTMQICASDPTLGGNEFEEQIKGWFVRDVGNLIGVLKNSGHDDSAEKLEAKVASDMPSRGHPELVDRVLAQAAL